MAIKKVKALPTIDPEVQAKFQKELEKHKDAVLKAKQGKKPIPARPKRPEGWVSRTEGETLVYNKVNELVTKMNEIIDALNK